jgi:hypothetical protein
MRMGFNLALNNLCLTTVSGVAPAATAPSAMTAAQWTLNDSPSAGGNTLSLNVTELPSNGGSAITALQYSVGGGATQTLSGVGTGARLITVLASTAASVELWAVNAIGSGTRSTAKVATPTATAGSTTDVEGLRYATTPNGRTSTATLKIPNVDTQTGLAFNAGTKTVTLSGTVELITDWDFTNWTVNVNTGANIKRITQCKFGETVDNGFSYFLNGDPTAVIRLIDYCTFEGSYDLGGAGTAINCSVSGSGTSITLFDVRKISRCRFLGLNADTIKAAGSESLNGQRVEWCYFGAPVNLHQYAPLVWSAATTYAVGDYVNDASRNTRNCVSLVDGNLNNAIPTGTVSTAYWKVLDPHGDAITSVAAKNGLSIRNCLFDWNDDPIGAFGPYYNQGVNNAFRFARNTGTDYVVDTVLVENCSEYHGAFSSYPIQVSNNGNGNYNGPFIFRNSKIGVNASGSSFHPSGDGATNYWVGVTRSDTGATITPPTGASTTDIAAAPVNTVAPTLSGTLTTGATITPNRGTFTGWPMVYQDLTLQRSADGTTGWADVTTDSTYTLVSGDAGQYFRVAAVGENSSGTVTAYSTVSGPIAAGYVQNFINTNGTGDLTSTIGGTATKFEFAVWVKMLSLSTPATPRLIRASTAVDIYLGSSGVLSVQFWDSSGSAIYGGTSTSSVLTTGLKTLVYVSYDAVAGAVVIKVNGVDVAMSISTGPLTGNLRPNRSHGVMKGASGVSQAIISDFYMNYHSGSMLGHAAFWNGGTPPNVTTLGTPSILLGGTMKADADASGNTARGWNDGYNLGTATLTVGSATFTDASP